MSPQFMAGRGRPDVCPCVPGLRRKIRRFEVAGFLLIVLALAAIAASVPVEGVAGAGLGLTGIAAVWTGWYLVVRRAGPLKVELKAATAPARTNRGRTR